MSNKMNSAPVFYTLAQIKFNPIEQMVTYIPQLQEEWRRKGYPDFRADTQVALAVRQLDKEQPEFKSQQNTRWSFSNTQRTEGYLLLSDALVFHSSVYDSFKAFSEKLLNGLHLINNTIGLAYVERIGMRYLNRIAPDEHQQLSDYLVPSLLGFSSIINGVLKHNFTEVMTNIDNDTLVARLVIIDGGLALPPDLSPLTLQIQDKFSTFSGKSATLDIDYFSNMRFDFDIRPITTQLIKSHDVLGQIFRSAVTEYAISVWR